MQSILCIPETNTGMDIIITFNPLPGDIIDVSDGKQLPTRDIVVNMDGGVGGSWKQVEYIEVGGQTIPTQQNLPESDSKPIDLK